MEVGCSCEGELAPGAPLAGGGCRETRRTGAPRTGRGCRETRRTGAPRTGRGCRETRRTGAPRTEVRGSQTGLPSGEVRRCRTAGAPGICACRDAGHREKYKQCAERQPGSAGLGRDENPGAAAPDFESGVPQCSGELMLRRVSRQPVPERHSPTAGGKAHATMDRHVANRMGELRRDAPWLTR
jgi:hypothetical protein